MACTIYLRAGGGEKGRWYVAGAIQETGLDNGRVGDNGCSKGVFQWNTCARGAVPQDLIGSYINEIDAQLDKDWGYGRSMVRWNCPACAESGSYKTSYYYGVLKHYNNLTN